VDDEGMKESFEGRSFQNPIEFYEGDEIFRILAYAEDDLLNNQELIDRADEIVPEAQYQIDSSRLKIPIDRRLTLDRVAPDTDLLEDEKDRYIKRGSTGFKGGGNLRSFELFETVPIEMPEDLFGRIKDASIKGHTYHLDSLAIDPGYDNRVVAEVAAPKRKQPEVPPSWQNDLYLEVELYDSTEPANSNSSNAASVDSAIV